MKTVGEDERDAVISSDFPLDGGRAAHGCFRRSPTANRPGRRKGEQRAGVLVHSYRFHEHTRDCRYADHAWTSCTADAGCRRPHASGRLGRGGGSGNENSSNCPPSGSPRSSSTSPASPVVLVDDRQAQHLRVERFGSPVIRADDRCVVNTLQPRRFMSTGVLPRSRYQSMRSGRSMARGSSDTSPCPAMIAVTGTSSFLPVRVCGIRAAMMSSGTCRGERRVRIAVRIVSTNAGRNSPAVGQTTNSSIQ